MFQRVCALACLALTTSGVAAAGPIADAFSPGFRGVSWTSTCAPDQVLPGGTWEKPGPTRRYRIRDDKPEFGVPRDAASYIDYFCSINGKVGWVTITFPGSTAAFEKLSQALIETFGKPMEGGPYGFLRWPEDGGFDLQAGLAEGDLLTFAFVTITRTVGVSGGRSQMVMRSPGRDSLAARAFQLRQAAGAP